MTTFVLRVCARDECDEVFDFSPSARSGAARRRYCTKACAGIAYRVEQAAELAASQPIEPPPLWPSVLMPKLGEWAAQAACKDGDPLAFDLPTSEEVAADPVGALARQEDAAFTCADCPVRAECYAAGVAHDGSEGVWGGVLMGARGRGRDLVALLETPYFDPARSARSRWNDAASVRTPSAA